jgi:4'-phosphopantetheinyl transferase
MGQFETLAYSSKPDLYSKKFDTLSEIHLESGKIISLFEDDKEAVLLLRVNAREIEQKEIDLYESVMSFEESEKNKDYKKECHRKTQKVTRILTRKIMGALLFKNPKDLQFTANKYGRPKVANFDSSYSFNISHTGSCINFVVSSFFEVGVDVENLERKVNLEIASRYFSPREVIDLKKKEESVRPFAFLSYWCLKESFIKAIGKGLSMPLADFSFDLSVEENITITINEEDQYRDYIETKWSFYLLKLDAPYLTALALGRKNEKE